VDSAAVSRGLRHRMGKDLKCRFCPKYGAKFVNNRHLGKNLWK
jgi:hypothetical protein